MTKLKFTEGRKPMRTITRNTKWRVAVVLIDLLFLLDDLIKAWNSRKMDNGQEN